MKPLCQIICLVLINLLLIPQAFAAQPIGDVSEVTGGVDILRGGKLPAEPAKLGDKIVQGDVIRTKSGGKAQIKMKDDSVLTIAPDSRVALNEYVYEPEKNQRQASIKIFQGLVHTVVNKVFKKDTPDFTVETQTAVIGVRGTDYYTLVGPALSDIYNNSGKTEVRNIFAEVPGKVTLQNKEYTQVGRNLPPTLPMPLTQDDINFIKGQMVPKVAAKPTGSGTVSNQNQLMGKVAGSAVATQNASTTSSTMPGQINPIQNLQSAVYVPPQPVPVPVVVTPVAALPVPLNLYVTWGSGARDLDLYLTGPTGTFYYGNTGTSSSPIYYPIDSVVPNGAEVITISNWTTGVYTAYVQDFTNQFGNSTVSPPIPPNPNSTVLSSSSGVSMQFIKGGNVDTSSGNKAVVTGGTAISSPISPPSGLAGNNWTAVSLNPSTGTITPINTIGQYITPTSTTTTVTTNRTTTPTTVTTSTTPTTPTTPTLPAR